MIRGARVANVLTLEYEDVDVALCGDRIAGLGKGYEGKTVVDARGAVLGTSTVTSYVESASGIAQGGRTGLSALVTGALFLVALFFTPVVGMVPAYATAPALIVVGVYMMMSLRDLNFDDWTELVPSLLGFIMMPLSYSIAVGIEFAIVSYVLIKWLSGKSKDVSWLMAALAVVFVLEEALA